MAMEATTRPKSPSRLEAMAKTRMLTPFYSNGVLLGNWVEEKAECPRTGTLYFPPNEQLDYDKLKPESRCIDNRTNKLNSTQGSINSVILHDSHEGCPNYATTTDLVYNHLPRPLCGPMMRKYRIAPHQFCPQPDLLPCMGNATEWGLRKYMLHEWKCTDVSDYWSTLYEDTYVAPRPHQYLQRCERNARNSLVLIEFYKNFPF